MMAPVRVKYVVSFSTQDDCHKASNLVTSDGSKYWLSNRKNNSGKAEIVLQLEESTQLAYLDIGTVWCATLELRVGRSDWHQTMEFKPLLPTVMLMSPLDCRLSRGTKTTQMFSLKDFSQEVSHELWDRLHIICRQPYRKDVQFGISFIHIKNVNPSLVSAVQSDSNTTLSSADKPILDASAIHKHFFGETTKNVEGSPTDMLKYRLMKMSGSAENGCDQVEALSRTAKLVLKASENNGPCNQRHTSSPLSKKGLFSQHVAKKSDLPIDKEMKVFMSTLNLTAADIDKVTVADLRHKFEKKKRRKLTKEEKIMFSQTCQDFICDMLDKNNSCLETENSGLFLQNKIQKESFMLDNKYGNQSNGNSTSWSASRVKGTPGRKKESSLMKTEKRTETECKMSSPVNCISGVMKSSLSNVCFNKDGNIKCFTSETPTKSEPLLESCFIENNSNVSSDNVIPEESFPEVSTVILNEKEVFCETLKKRRKWGLDKPNAQNLVCENQGLLLRKEQSLHKKQTHSEEKNICEGNSTTNTDVISDISDRKTHSNHEDLKLKTFETPVHKVVTVDNVNKPCRKLCDEINSAQNVVSPKNASVSSGKPQSKLKRLSKASFDLFQEFSMEIMNSEDDKEHNNITGLQTDFSAGKQFFQSENTNIIHPPQNCGTKDKNVTCSINSTPEKSTCPLNDSVVKNKTSKFTKAKIYRMYSSRNKSKVACCKETNSHLDNPGSNSLSNNCGAQKYLCNKDGALSDIDDKCDAEKYTLSENMNVKKKKCEILMQIADITPNVKDGLSRVQENKKYMNVTRPVSSNHLSNGASQASRKKNQKNDQTNTQRAESIATNTTLCDICHGRYPTKSLYTHKVFCSPLPSYTSGGLPTFGQPSRTGSVNEMFIDETVDYAECPICLQRFPQDVLLVHASECGL